MLVLQALTWCSLYTEGMHIRVHTQSIIYFLFYVKINKTKTLYLVNAHVLIIV